MPSVELDTESEVIVDPAQTLNGLQRKADIMQDMIETGQVEQPPIGVMRWLVRFWFSRLVSDEGIEGLDNLQNAIVRARTENKRLMFTPAHLADADHHGALYLMAREGRGLGIQNGMVFMGGVNMQRRPSIKRFMRSEHVIYNVTPRDMNHLETLLERRDEFSKKQSEKLRKIETTFKEMRATAMERVNEVCIKGGKPLVVYIEGGRSYDGTLKRPLKDFARFFPRGDGAIVVPYRVYGTRELNPPGTDPKVFRRELLPRWAGGMQKQGIRMIVGEYYPSSEIWRVWRARREELGRESDINPMDWVMANIANLDPSYIRPEDLRYYGELMQSFALERNRMKIPDEAATQTIELSGSS